MIQQTFVKNYKADFIQAPAVEERDRAQLQSVLGTKREDEGREGGENSYLGEPGKWKIVKKKQNKTKNKTGRGLLCGLTRNLWLANRYLSKLGSYLLTLR